MALVQCAGCSAIHESTSPVCPTCGRCPCCGALRITRAELKQLANCPACNTPYCAGCGRCHQCGEIRFQDLGSHDCGFPSDPERVRGVEKTFGLKEKSEGCLGVLFAIGLVFVSGLIGFGLMFR